MASDFACLLQFLGVRKCAVLAHSLATLWAINIATLLPDRVVGIVLVSPMKRCTAPLPAEFIATRVPSLEDVMVGSLAEAIKRSKGMLEGAMAPEASNAPERYARFAADPFWVSLMWDSLRGFRNEKRFLAARRCDHGWIIAPRLPSDDAALTSCAIHVIAGEKDSVTPIANAKALEERFAPTCRLHVLPDTAHSLAPGPTDDFCKALEEALEAIRPRLCSDTGEPGLV